MTEAEIMDIVVKHMQDKTTREALVLSQRDIGLRLIDLVVGPSFNKDFLRILQTIAEGQATFSFFSWWADERHITREMVVTGFTTERLIALLEMYKKFKEAMVFLYRHYDEIDFGNYAEDLPKDELGLLIEDLNETYLAHDTQFETTQTIALTSGELQLIGQGFSIVYAVLLGEGKYLEFVEEFNGANAILRKIQAELIPDSMTNLPDQEEPS